MPFSLPEDDLPLHEINVDDIFNLLEQIDSEKNLEFHINDEDVSMHKPQPMVNGWGWTLSNHNLFQTYIGRLCESIRVFS